MLEEISDGVLLLVYDLPTEEPVKTLIRNNNLSPGEREAARRLKNKYACTNQIPKILVMKIKVLTYRRLSRS